MTAGSLDANVILRLLLNDVPTQHAAALALLSAGDAFIVSDTAMIETIFVLGRAYELTREQQREAAVGVLGQPSISGSLELFEAAFELYLVHPKLSFEDCYLVASAATTAAEPLWTFDKKLALQTSARLVETA